MSPRVSAEQRERYLETRRNQILDAAIDIFGNKGLDAATVDDLARAAGISKGTVYLYFKSKDEIFDAILAERSSLPLLIDSIDYMKNLKYPEEFSLQSFLEETGIKFLKIMEKDYPLLRLVLADAYRYPLQAEHVYNNLILKANTILADFITAQSATGRIRESDSPLITARCFVGMLLIYVLSQEILGGNKFVPIKPEDWVKEAVKIFLNGVQINDE
jgi:AcrR family transcriptional regulator